ncbi:MAG: TetR/AcrR family transcriptional regulator [Candidatus Cyclobacteriaceae bacterium M3_2C_046]
MSSADKSDQSTQEKILKAAEEVFQDKGFDGARMQEIADKAHINKGLLHYYFRTKNKLFEAIFVKAFNHLFGSINALLSTEKPLQEKLDLLIDKYLDLLLMNPAIPRFVINELNLNAEAFVNRVMTSKNRPDLQEFFTAVEKEMEAGRIRPIDPKHLLMNIVAMCVFPFIGKPMLQGIFQLDQKQFKNLMLQRKVQIKTFVKNALQP